MTTGLPCDGGRKKTKAITLQLKKTGREIKYIQDGFIRLHRYIRRFSNCLRTYWQTDGRTDGQTLLKRYEDASKKGGYTAQNAPSTRLKITGDGRTKGRSSGRTDGQTILKRYEDASKNGRNRLEKSMGSNHVKWCQIMSNHALLPEDVRQTNDGNACAQSSHRRVADPKKIKKMNKRK